jgi:hypothetical protein
MEKEKRKMPTIKKTAALMIVILFAISIGTSTFAFGHTPPLQIPMYPFINVAPNPAAVGQTVTVGFWLAQAPPTASGPYGDRWQNMTIIVTHPDGTKETLGPFTSDDTGGTFTQYTPSTEGNYTFKMVFGGQTLLGNNPPPANYSAAIKSYIGDYYQPAESRTTMLTVQQNAIPFIPQNPLPTTYWETPINAENVGTWYSIGGDWLGLGQIFSGNTGGYNATGNYNPYTTAPQTAHVLWTKPLASGGALGGEFGGTTTSNYYTTSQYEPKFCPVILNGILYYEQYPGSLTNPTGILAVDLHTGETLWNISAPLTSGGTPTVLRCGQILNYVSPNQYGGLSYLWTTGTLAGMNVASGTTTYNMFDAMTGNYVLSIVNGSAFQTLTEDDGGNLIGYYVNSTIASAPKFCAWNSTQCILAGTNGEAAWQWRPTQNAQIDFGKGIMWSMPMPTNISGAALPGTLALTATGMATFMTFINSGVALLTSSATTGGNLFQAGFRIDAGFSSKTGALLWIENRTETPFSRAPVMAGGYGNYIEVNYATGVLTAYSLSTGQKQWTTPLPNPNPYNSIGGYQADIAKGTMYIWGLGGDIYSVNMLTGVINWQTSTVTIHGDPGANTPYGVWPIWTFPVGTIADGLLFLGEGHEYSPPLFHGAQQLAVNITTGELKWSILSFDVSNSLAIANGIGTVLNSYDNQIYAYGKGPSAMSVVAPNTASTAGTPIVIRGTVTDISPGSKQRATEANFPSGLPCVSDASMSHFMEQVYMQQPAPNNTTGVPIVVSVLDSNGNFRQIGTTTSDGSGMFSLTWKPDISGDYTVVATFAGSESYYPSSAETSFTVTEPSPTPTPTQVPVQSMADTYILPGIIGIIVAIVIVGIVLALLVTKKRP